jgi:hypothetical protein
LKLRKASPVVQHASFLLLQSIIPFNRRYLKKGVFNGWLEAVIRADEVMFIAVPPIWTLFSSL